MRGACHPETSPEFVAGDATAQRRALRKRVLAAREAVPPAQIETWSAAIRDHLQRAFPSLAAQRVAFCWPIRGEPDLRPLMTDWYAQGLAGFQALLPVVDAPGEALSFREWRPGCLMQEDRYGIPTPHSGPSAAPDCLLIPVNAFDSCGYRLGYGGGFFDRTLAALSPRPQAIGVGFELARVDTIHPQRHDMRLDAIVTEAGVFGVD